MRAVLCKELGPPESLTVEDIDDPVAGPGEVVVDMRAAGVNFPDVLIVQGKYQFKPDLPFSPGGELAGVISQVGEGVQHLSVGDHVICSTGHGAFAEKVLVNAQMVIPMPPGLDFKSAAAFVLTYGTSWHALKDRGALKAGETVLVLGAAGGVGLSAIQIAKALGAKVIAAASTDEKLAVCKENGADETLNYSTEDLRERVKALTDGNGPDVIYDPVGGQFAEPAFRSIGWRGRYLVIGFANGDIPSLPLNLALLKGAAIIGVFWGSYISRESGNFAKDLQDMFVLMGEAKLKPHVSATFPLEQGAEAICHLANRKATGKVVITCEA